MKKNKLLYLLGDGVLLLGILLGHFSIGGSKGLGNIFDEKCSDFSSDLGGADIGLTLLIWVGFLNPKDDASPLVAGCWIFGYWLAWEQNKHLVFYLVINQQFFDNNMDK